MTNSTFNASPQPEAKSTVVDRPAPVAGPTLEVVIHFQFPSNNVSYALA